MKKTIIFTSFVFVFAIILAGCGNSSKQNDCEKACENLSGEQKTLCLSTCKKAADQYDKQGETKGTLKGKTDSKCESFSGIAKNSCYAGLAMDNKDEAYCDNIPNIAERSECKDNAK